MAGDRAGSLSGRRVLLGVSGGIAAYKAAYLARRLVESGAEVQALMTASATRFLGPATLAAITGRSVPTDVFDSPEMVVHVHLAHWADVAVVAPATANLMAQLALGLTGDLLTATLLESSRPLVLAPAMHTGMWTNPATQGHVRSLVERGAMLVGPVSGHLAAGDEGMGRMAEPEDILAAVVEVLDGGAPGPDRDLAGRRVLVTAGPTHEPIDPVRYLGNRSTGKMGFAIAGEAARRGAEVTLVAGPVSLPDPPGVNVVRVETAEEMRAAVASRAEGTDAVVMAAAVADFRPADVSTSKIKKEGGVPSLSLERTPDILSELGKRKERQVLVGFAAETGGADALVAEGRRKLAEKNLDLIVVNEVGRPGTGFGSDTNTAAILARSGEDAPLREWTKAALASAICDRVAALLSS
jgi:phosphopantothenoylcysteine decarboxylase/phosphopantothenate--cysteine ligase